MDPIQSLLERLRTLLPATLQGSDFEASMARQVQTFFAHFELVPKHEFEAQVQLLESLEAQIASLESRLATLDQGAKTPGE